MPVQRTWYLYAASRSAAGLAALLTMMHEQYAANLPEPELPLPAAYQVALRNHWAELTRDVERLLAEPEGPEVGRGGV
jgi:hypothetical protein